MIIIKPKHASKLPIDLWSRYARVVVCEDYTRCIKPGLKQLLEGAGFAVVSMYNETGHPNIYAEAIKR